MTEIEFLGGKKTQYAFQHPECTDFPNHHHKVTCKIYEQKIYIRSMNYKWCFLQCLIYNKYTHYKSHGKFLISRLKNYLSVTSITRKNAIREWSNLWPVNNSGHLGAYERIKSHAAFGVRKKIKWETIWNGMPCLMTFYNMLWSSLSCYTKWQTGAAMCLYSDHGNRMGLTGRIIPVQIS